MNKLKWAERPANGAGSQYSKTSPPLENDGFSFEALAVIVDVMITTAQD
jgi:hypothetical protein